MDPAASTTHAGGAPWHQRAPAGHPPPPPAGLPPRFTPLTSASWSQLLADRKREEQWLDFSLRQAARAAPHPCPASLLHGGAPQGCRLTLSFLEAWPLFQAEDRDFGIRLGVTLFDEAAGCFFGPTAHSAVAEYEMKRSRGWAELRQCMHNVSSSAAPTSDPCCFS